MQLSLVNTMSQLTEKLPGITEYQVKAARKVVKDTGIAALPPQTYQEVKRNRLGMIQTQS